MERLILASASPRRAMLLRQIGVDFLQMASGIGEDMVDMADPADHVLLLSQRKAAVVAERTKERWVLGADTVVVLDYRILGKPEDRELAACMLTALSGRVHSVFTGLTLCDSRTGRSLSQVEVTKVWIRRLNAGEISAYVRTGEPMGKAGGYAIQGLGATLVERIEGCYYNVVGLPVVRLLRMMHIMQYPFPFIICPCESDTSPKKKGGEHEDM